MGNEPEPETLGEGGHFGYGNHVTARAAQHYDVGVIDHNAACRAAEVAMRIRQKHFAVEALKRRIELEKEHVRVAQNRRGRLHIAAFAAEYGVVRRRVMLHLLARLEVILARRLLFDLTDAVTTAERRQRLIGQFCSFGNQLLMDPDQVAAARGMELQKPLPVRLGALRTRDGRNFG